MKYIWYFYERINTQICSYGTQGLIRIHWGCLINDISERNDRYTLLHPYGEDYG